MIIPIIEWLKKVKAKKERVEEIPITHRYTHGEIKGMLLDSMRQAVADNNKANLSLHGLGYVDSQLVIVLSYDDNKKSTIVVGIPNVGEKSLQYNDYGEITNGTRIFMATIWQENDDDYAVVNFFSTSPKVEERVPIYSVKEADSIFAFASEKIREYRP